MMEIGFVASCCQVMTSRFTLLNMRRLTCASKSGIDGVQVKSVTIRTARKQAKGQGGRNTSESKGTEAKVSTQDIKSKTAGRKGSYKWERRENRSIAWVPEAETGFLNTIILL